MRDNKTSKPAQEYDGNFGKTMLYHSFFHEETLRLIKAVNPRPETWLDAGCGTGILVSKALNFFADTHFVMMDPSAAMLDIAKEKFAGRENMKLSYVLAGTEEADFPTENFDVITAILAHHYFNKSTRQKATANCLAMLKKGGTYVTFETILPSSDQGIKIGLERWKTAIIKNGKDAAAAEQHISRFGTELLPITAMEHIELLHKVGFSVVEILWASGVQMGFYAIK
ncbi:tRNA (cmo5U34)-methyltransferase [Sporomusaceae bacterium BoRhaA]|uniref:class I SAM-dependent methyltransferase n=1 Tax=Pelorhabdus rhamnosifermentans TaxID=2772457 RepID=UPI001C063F1F|nr:class I SAM-dependent methyltransferase [Pelorhabdus rhamnosifermentans]MBU2700511.1 tRNA (cmo5U34)-methyltransferase [Pelorhabdus rhamnosifermentans]